MVRFDSEGVVHSGRRLRALHRSIRCRDARQRRAQGPRHDGDRAGRRRAGHDRLARRPRHPPPLDRARARAGRAGRSNPEAKLGIGPPVTDGFYYDFDVAEPFTPEDLKALDKEMDRIVRQGQRFVRRVVTDDEARAELADEPYKLELIGLKGHESGTAQVERERVRRGRWRRAHDLRQRRPQDGRDRLEGPLPRPAPAEHAHDRQRLGAHRASPRRTGAVRRRTRSCSASTAPRGRRRTSCAPTSIASRRPPSATTASSAPSSTSSRSPRRSAAACPCSTRRAASSSARWRTTSAAATSRRASSTSRPRTSRRRTSSSCPGHLPYYADAMFPPMELENSEYYLKPMNCPMQNLIFRSRGRSLPRAAAAALRVRHRLPLREVRRRAGPHPRARPDPGRRPQLRHARAGAGRDHSTCSTSCSACCATSASTTSTSSCRPATRHPTSSRAPTSSGTVATERAARGRRGIRASSSCPTRAAPPSTARRSRCRRATRSAAPGRCRPSSTTSTSPRGFELEYTAADGSHQQPVMIHSAKFGSIERFFGVLIEHYAGAFPVWLSPVQVVGIPVADEYCRVPRRRDRPAAPGGRARRARHERRPHAEEDPHAHHAEGAVPAHRGRERPRRRDASASGSATAARRTACRSPTRSRASGRPSTTAAR